MFKFRKSKESQAGDVEPQYQGRSCVDGVADPYPGRTGRTGDQGDDQHGAHGRFADDGEDHRLSVEVGLRLHQCRRQALSRALHFTSGSLERQDPRTEIRYGSVGGQEGRRQHLPVGCRSSTGAADRYESAFRGNRRRCDPRMVGSRTGLEAGCHPGHHQRRLDQHPRAGRLSRAMRGIVRSGSWLHADRRQKRCPKKNSSSEGMRRKPPSHRLLRLLPPLLPRHRQRHRQPRRPRRPTVSPSQPF